MLPRRSAAELTTSRQADVWDEYELIPIQVVDADVFHAPIRAEFLAWLNASRSRFPLPLSTETRAGQTVLRAGRLHKGLEIRLESLGDISVSANHEGFCWDTLARMDVSAMEKLDGSGWQNISVRPQHRRTYPTREACWREEGFEPLLDWVRDELAVATHLALYGDDEFTWTAASLACNGMLIRANRSVADDRERLRHLLPLEASATISAGLERP